jgi:hypothetical protein
MRSRRLESHPLRPALLQVVGGRLYTGPMFEKYNAVLRWHTGNTFLRSQCGKLGVDGRFYVTTIHAINSLIIKGSKLMVVAKVFRGIKGGLLPASFWVPDQYGVMGGVEFGFLSMTLDRSQAEHYASEGQASTIFEMQMGMGAQRCCQVRTHHHTRTEYLPIFLEAAGIVSLGRPYTCVCC